METERLVETVIKAQQGFDSAMQDLYLDAYRSVYYLALRMVKNPEDAEDITQEVFITVHEKISELREPIAFYKWINQITANKCYRLLSKYKGMALLADDAEILAIPDDNPLNMPDKAIDDEDTRRIILEVIDRLPDAQRVCVMLYYYSQNTIAQIADTLDINENTVKSRLSLARAKIRVALEEKEKKEDIKLYGIPLALTPILRQAMEQITMPDGLSERIWENVSQSIISSPTVDNTHPPGGNGEMSGQSNKAAQATNLAGKAATGSAMTLVTKIIFGVIAVSVVTAGALIIPRLIEPPPETEQTEQADGERAPDLLNLWFEKSDEGNMVYWTISDYPEPVAGFEFAAAPVGSDEWKSLVTVPADYGGYQIERIASYLSDGEYRIRLTTLADQGFLPSEPAYITGTLTVKTGNHPKNSYETEKFDNRFAINGFDEHLTLYFMTITRNGVPVNDITWFDTNWRADIGFEAIAFENGYGGSQPGDMVSLRELIDTTFDGENYTVNFAAPSDPVIIP